MAAPNPPETNIESALRSFLLSVLPTGVEVVKGQENRVPEPLNTDFVVFTSIRRRRIETNIDAYADALGSGTIAGSTMTVDFMQFGSVLLGGPVFGVGVLVPTTVTAFLTGTGGVGTYTISPSQNVAEETLAFGTFGALQPVEITYQVDVHGPNSANNAQTITTLFRDEYAVDQFAASGFGDIVPLHADDPRQVPFINDAQQYEDRWIVEALLQANQIVTVPQQFASLISVILKEVDTTFPP